MSENKRLLGRGRAHHVGGDKKGDDLVHVEGYYEVDVQLEQHASDFSGARRIHRLPHARPGHPRLVTKWRVEKEKAGA